MLCLEIKTEGESLLTKVTCKVGYGKTISQNGDCMCASALVVPQIAAGLNFPCLIRLA